MHDTAMHFGKAFFDTYLPGATDLTIMDLGAQDVNGSLRSVAPPGCKYVGVDFADAKGVDVVLADPYKLPFEDASMDVCVSANCLEHSEFFWLTFLEVIRVLKPNGLFYLDVPASGAFHRYPVDCWRFYPDAGQALARWAQRNGYKTTLLEAFVGRQGPQLLNDFIGVYVKDEAHVPDHPRRILDTSRNILNGTVHGREGFANFFAETEDRFWHRKYKKALAEGRIAPEPEAAK